MISQDKYEQYGFPRENDIKIIVVHNTGNYDMNAQQLHDYMNTECQTSQGCHYLVDNEQVLQVMPLNYSVYHTGKGIDYACKYGIAIEICSNIDNTKYKLGQDKAVALIKDLMEEYDLTTNDIYFHKDFAPVYCPCNILDIYGNKKNFIREEF